MDGEVLRDDQRERLKPFVPGGRKGKRGPRSDGRRFLDAVLWLARSGARWRDMPEERFGSHQTIKRRYYRWIEQGVFDRQAGAMSFCWPGPRVKRQSSEIGEICSRGR